MKAAALVVNLALLALVFYLGTISVAPEGVPLPGNDKIGHALAFFTVAAAQYWAFHCYGWPARGAFSARMRLFCATLGATAVGGLLECVQFFLPFRNAEFGDLGADALGAIVGASLLFLILG